MINFLISIQKRNVNQIFLAISENIGEMLNKFQAIYKFVRFLCFMYFIFMYFISTTIIVKKQLILV